MIYLTSDGQLFLETNDGMNLINLDSILYFKAEGAYTKLILKERDYLIICKHLIVFEKLIKAHGFFKDTQIIFGKYFKNILFPK